MFIKRHHQPSKIPFLSLLLKIASEGVSLTSELNGFQSLGPRNEIDFCPFNVLKRGTRKSALVLLSLIVVRAEFCTNSSDRYSGARPLFDLYPYLRCASCKRFFDFRAGFGENSCFQTSPPRYDGARNSLALHQNKA